MARVKNSCWWSVQSTLDERDTVDIAAKAAGLTRNAFVRRWIAELAREQRKKDLFDDGA